MEAQLVFLLLWALQGAKAQNRVRLELVGLAVGKDSSNPPSTGVPMVKMSIFGRDILVAQATPQP